ncbi:DUF4097 family beta strand repeat protein [Tumebacillus sp. ITR2]|uniref:DUF4097 family beta strand repeat protein n=1 Tax=Tumebacillus amylolyticus TaxID=2801339 RepID=A0ABS1JA56_9BACL|nr:DUF4097 family beta strand repeat-containing protein [Tumebacillus amylolyticus]MBL0387134.1 DUF4097 family beta strand repeat protein [Tumebacillus amylolyticus]
MKTRTAIGLAVIAIGVAGLIGAGLTYFQPQDILAEKFAGTLESKLDNIGNDISNSINENSFSSEKDTQREEGDLQLDVKNAKKLIVNSEVGNIHVVGAGSNTDGTLHFVKGVFGYSDAEATKFLQNVKLDVVRNGDTVNVNVNDAANKWLKRLHIDLEISIPETLDVQLTNKVGEITTQGLQSAVTVASEVGSINIQGYKGTVKANSKTGKLDIAGGQDIASVNVETNVGKVIVALPADANLNLEAQTDIGHINNELTLNDSHIDRQKVTGTLGDGSKGHVYIKTNAGSIDITKQ